MVIILFYVSAIRFQAVKDVAILHSRHAPTALQGACNKRQVDLVAVSAVGPLHRDVALKNLIFRDVPNFYL